MSRNHYSPIVGYLSSLAAGLSFGFIPILAAVLRDFGASSIEQVILRLAFGAVFGLGFLIFLSFKHRISTSLDSKIQCTYILQGFLFALMIVVYISSVALQTPVGEAALLVQVHPFITLLFGRLFLKERITLRKIIALAIAFTGIIILVEPWKWQSFLSSLAGDLFAFFNGFFYASYLLVGRGTASTRKEISAFTSISWVLVWGFILGIPLVALLSVFPLPSSLVAFSFSTLFSPKIVGFAFLLAVSGSILPYSLLMVTAHSIESSKASLVLLVEPLGAIVFGFIILREPITLAYLLGGLCIIIAFAITISETFQKRQNDTNLAD